MRSIDARLKKLEAVQQRTDADDAHGWSPQDWKIITTDPVAIALHGEAQAIWDRACGSQAVPLAARRDQLEAQRLVLSGMSDADLLALHEKVSALHSYLDGKPV